MTDKNLPAIRNSSIDYNDNDVMQLIKNTICIGATEAEFRLFLEFGKSTKLNAFKKELWFIKGNDGRIQMMTGLNGFYSIANDHPEYDGIETGLINEKGEWVRTCVGKFIGGWARVYRKDRNRPFEAEALMSEFGKAYGAWKTSPSYMIKKVAESHALRKSFPQELNGLNTEEEMPATFEQITGIKAGPTDQAAAIEHVISTADSIDQSVPDFIYYRIPDITIERKLFMEKRGASFDEARNVWLSAKDLGPKLNEYKVDVVEAA